MRTSATLAGLLLTTGLLAGCGSDGGNGGGDTGGDSTSAYCDEIKSAQGDLDTIMSGTSPDFTQLDQAITRMQEIAAKAPEAVDEEWGRLSGALTQVTDALDEAGLSLEDLGTMMETQELPEGVDVGTLAQIGEDLQALDNEGLQEAADAIAKHAEDECGIEMDAPSAPEPSAPEPS